MTEAEYFRESNYLDHLPVPDDVKSEQEKINGCDAIAFIYPVFWTEAPAKLVGWFDRVWTYGFAYGNRTMKQLKKALCICTTGHSIEHLKQYGHLYSMKTLMLEDRIFDRAIEKQMVVLDCMTKYDAESRKRNWDKHLLAALELGKAL